MEIYELTILGRSAAFRKHSLIIFDPKQQTGRHVQKRYKFSRFTMNLMEDRNPSGVPSMGTFISMRVLILEKFAPVAFKNEFASPRGHGSHMRVFDLKMPVLWIRTTSHIVIFNWKIIIQKVFNCLFYVANTRGMNDNATPDDTFKSLTISCDITDV